MTTKQFLNRAFWIYKEIGALEKERVEAWERATSVTAVYEGERVQTSRKNNKAAVFSARAEYDALIDEKKAELYKAKGEILRAINGVENDKLRLLLTCRYIRFMKWERVAEEMGYSTYHVVHRLHPKALYAAEEVLKTAGRPPFENS